MQKQYQNINHALVLSKGCAPGGTGLIKVTHSVAGRVRGWTLEKSNLNVELLKEKIPNSNQKQNWYRGKGVEALILSCSCHRPVSDCDHSHN